ncbi:hypothetical protein GH811_06575 [Acetobacterium malicum]|uniref:SbsA Ig-like domain-containing protein n=1 Tax=Acetobacterium malicum TaxID=52692 RepID=A0ABR6YVZ6_9FIRM|nr:hypothetical protein [Acetobacterium malicum]MBC3899275.1 hypothetical protein [Acetobacterium malicum]
MSCFCANNVKEIEVTFSTPVTGFNSTLVLGTQYDITDPSGASLSASSGTATIAKITDSKYKITTSKEMGLGEYTFKINKDVVTSTDLQKNPLQFVKFQGSAGKDTTPPTVSSASYNANSGEVVVNFSEPVKIESVVKTGFVVTDGTTKVTLTSNESAILSNSDTTVTFGLSTATKTSVAALGTTKTLEVAAGAIKDKADNAIAAVTGISLSPVAQLSAASFDASTNLLTLNFTKAVNVSTLTVANIQMNSSAGAFNLDANDKIQTTTNGTAIQIKLAEDTTTAAFKGSSVTNRKVTLTQDAFFKTTDAEPQQVITSTTNITYTADTGKPVLVSATYNTNGTLVLQFNKPVKNSIATAVQMTDWLTGSTPTSMDTVASARMTTGTGYSDVLTYTAAQISAPGDNSLTTTASRLPTTTSKVYFAKDTFVDAAGNKNDALTSASGILINYVDQAAATVGSTATQIDLKTVQIAFDKEVTKTTAETIANYAITAPGASNLTVQSASLLADGKKVNLTVTQDATIGVNYTIKVSNVTTKYGNVPISTTSGNTSTWTAVTPSTTTGPDVTGVKYVDVNSNYKIDEGDKLQITYNQAIVVTGATKDDFTLSAGVFGTGATFLASSVSNQLDITLGASPTVAFGNTITQVATPHIKSVTGVNAVATSGAQTIASPDATTPAIATSVFEDTNADGSVSQGDRVTLTFTKDMDRSIAATTALGTVGTGAATTLQVSTAVAFGTGATGEWVDARTMRVNLGSSPNLAGTAVAYLGTATVKGGTVASIKDLWGNALDSTQGAITTTSNDTTRPTIQSVSIAAQNPTGNFVEGDKINFTMSEATNVNAAAAADELVLYQGTVPVLQKGTTAGAWTVSGNIVTYTVQAVGVDTEIVGKSVPSIGSVTITGARAGKIMDASANTTVTPVGFGLVPTITQR